MFSLARKKPGAFYFLVKRMIDVLMCSIALLLTLPLLLVLGLLIRLESPGSPFFRQIRLGKSEKPFVLYKLRSMYTGSPRQKVGWTAIGDSRITPIGRFIRKYHIDELPQLLNVIKGDMSIVGPRPEVPILCERFERQYPGFKDRLEVKPGLTGWAQINGGYDVTPQRKAELDLYYIKNQSLWFDFAIMFRTVGVLLSGEGAR